MKTFPGTRKIAAIILALAMVAGSASFVFLFLDHTKSTPHPAMTLGPKVYFNVLGGGQNTQIGNNTTITVQVFGIMPENVSAYDTIGENLTGLNPENNPYEVQLLNTTLDNTSQILFLSPEFLNLSLSWYSFFRGYSGTNYASLILEATKSVDVNGTVQIYTYFNNLPYNPCEVSLVHLSSQSTGNKSDTSWFTNTTVDPSSFGVLSYLDLAFQANLTFPSKPVQIIGNVTAPPDSRVATVSPELASTTGSCPAGGTYTTTFWAASSSTYDSATTVNATNGVFPLLAVHMANNVANGHSEISLFGSILLQDATLGIESDQGYVTSSGQASTSMSGRPSYGNAAGASYEIGGNSYPVYPLNAGAGSVNLSERMNSTTAYVAIQGATYTFSHYGVYTRNYDNEYQRTVYYYYEPFYLDGKEYCREVITASSTSIIKSVYEGTVYDGTQVNGEISSISNYGNLQFTAGFLPIGVNAVLTDIFRTSNAANLTIADSGTGNSLSASTFWASDSAYTNASQAMQDAKAATTLFAASLTEGLAISDALAAVNEGEVTEGAIVAETMDLIAGMVGLTGAVLSDFSTIGFVSSAKSAGIAFGITDARLSQYVSGSNYSMVDYESQSPISLSLNGNTYRFYAPNSYINATSIVSLQTSTANFQVSDSENSSQSSSSIIFQTGGEWSIDSSAPSKETAVYSVSEGAQYMAGNVFNQWQDFAFQPGFAYNAYAVGTVYANLTNYQGQVVASWSHVFNNVSRTSGWVYFNPMFTIPSPVLEPIMEIVFTNSISGLQSNQEFTSVGSGGLIAFAAGPANQNVVNYPQPENDEPYLAWNGFTTPVSSASWNLPSGTVSYTVQWAVGITSAITYDGHTEYGNYGEFTGSLSELSIYGQVYPSIWTSSPYPVLITLEFVVAG